ncbi:hypothetical protein GCM10007967_06550 [Xylanimonas ulmi]|uniref:D-alanyl-D-alanine carboxypeptidase-like protein n=1 Tax=Xylanimonas ulmi TaxID=228973 RepID=A0A4Q7M1X5_9MICO|nr:D-alanyl-D-alanine carboxypeptidase-like protein [Xylanibacterium ulmi]
MLLSAAALITAALCGVVGLQHLSAWGPSALASTAETQAPPASPAPPAHASLALDDDRPALANLDPALLSALRQAADAAAGAGVEFVVNSGWRSAQEQERLLADAVATYGSPEEAARWVASPTASAHVTGEAVDVGAAAAAWLSEHGAAYGLCQIYANESWHYELRPQAADDGCPAMYADASQDPRAQR